MLITIARVVKPQGRRGEVAAELHTDFPERFAERRRLMAVAPDGQQRELYLDEFWPHKGRVVLKFRGIDSISDAESLVGWELQIPRAERAALQAGARYVDELLGCRVVALAAAGRPQQDLGAVAEVKFGAGEAPLLVVRGDSGREYLIPFAEEFLRSVDTAHKRMEMVLPEGLLELDAPLSPEEKQAQARGHKPRG